MSEARDAARYLRGEAARAARETRAIGRGRVDGQQAETNRPIVQLPNGARVLSNRSRFLPAGTGTAVDLVRRGNGWDVLAPSPYGGGLGAPFVPEESEP